MGVLWSEDYEKVFGKPTKWSLFSEDEETYEAFRQTIINSPHYVYDKDKLPFAGVKVYGYDLYLLKLSVDQKKAEGKKLFYIKDETPGLAKVLAFGYYSNNTFYLMANSIIRKTEFQKQMKKISSLYWQIHELQADSVIRKCDIEAKSTQSQSEQLELFYPEGYRIIQDIECSASIAAAYVLGHEADYTRWKGMDGKTLAETYPFYSGSYSELIEIKTTWNKLRSLKEKPTPIVEEKGTDKLSLFDKIITPLIQYKEKEAAKITAPNRKELRKIHCFLKDFQRDSVDAEGYYNVMDGSMTILSGSLFSTDVTSAFMFTAKDYQRRSFLKYNCSTKGSKYVLKKDCVFNTLETATTYVLGFEDNGYYQWKTAEGEYLGEIIDEKIH